MAVLRAIAGLSLALLMSGCAFWSDQDPQTPPSTEVTAEGSPQAEDMPRYTVDNVMIDVPRTLVVSEANSYFPRGDIVWRGDPPGDRYEQVAAIFQEGMTRGVADLEGDVPVDINVEVLRFHSLTEKTRYSFGGVHSIRFELSIRSADTGELLEASRMVQADLKGYGGARAIEADQQGQTQKVRITDHLAHVITVEMSDPEGYENPRLGLIQFFDNRF